MPNVSYCVDRNEVHYNPYVHDYSQDYLTFVAKADGTFKLSGATTANTVSYSLDNGSTWTNLAYNTNSPTVTSGQKIMWKGTLTPTSNKGIGKFSSTAQFDVEGNSMSLLYGDDFKGETSLEGKNYAFYNLFSGCTMLESAEKMSLPATTLARYCYQNMFRGCTKLTTAPELPATTLVSQCYYYMFRGCTSLTTAPSLPAKTLAQSCYGYMFDGCTSLTTAPSVLPATRLTNQCYTYMFRGCTSLTTAPSLLATELASQCYNSMFNGCTSLNYIKAMFTTEPSVNYTSDWVSGVASSGTFVKNSAATWTTTGVNGIPSGWTVQTADA